MANIDSKFDELNKLKNLLKYFRIYINALLNNTPLNENVVSESYLSAFEIYHIPSSIISSIALNYVYWYKNIENSKKTYIYTNPNNIPINFFDSDDTIISVYKEEIFYAIAYINLVVYHDEGVTKTFLGKMSLKMNKFDFFTKSKNYFLIKCFGKKDKEYNKYLKISKEYLKKENNDLFLKQLAFRLNFPEKEDFKILFNYYIDRYNIFLDAISATKLLLLISESKKNISCVIELYNYFFNQSDTFEVNGQKYVIAKFIKNDINLKYLKSFYVNKILTQLTTYYKIKQNNIKLAESIKLIEDLGFEYKPTLNGETIYLVKGIDKNKNAWYYVLVDPNLIEEFNKQLSDEIIHLKQLGKILYSSYGDEPPENITIEIEKKYNIRPFIVNNLLIEKIT